MAVFLRKDFAFFGGRISKKRLCTYYIMLMVGDCTTTRRKVAVDALWEWQVHERADDCDIKQEEEQLYS